MQDGDRPARMRARIGPIGDHERTAHYHRREDTYRPRRSAARDSHTDGHVSCIFSRACERERRAAGAMAARWGQPKGRGNLTTVREAAFELFRRRGLTTIFGNPGSTELPMLGPFPEDFRYVLGLQEAVAVGMADGFAQ